MIEIALGQSLGRAAAQQATPKSRALDFRLVISEGGRITVAHASPGGALERACQDWKAQGMKLERLT